jgi:hypothetical protein
MGGTHAGYLMLSTKNFVSVMIPSVLFTMQHLIRETESSISKVYMMSRPPPVPALRLSSCQSAAACLPCVQVVQLDLLC